MMKTQLVFLLEAVAQLDRELTTAMEFADRFVASRQATELVHLRSTLGQALLTMRDMRHRVLDGTTDINIEYQELALRARTAVVLMQLADLREAEYELSASPSPFIGRFKRVLDLATFLLDRVERINGAALRGRSSMETTGPQDVGRAARQALYGLALNDAERAFAALGKEPDVASFLDAGLLVRSERFRFACRTLAMVLDVLMQEPAARAVATVPELPSLARRPEQGTGNASSAIPEQREDP